MRALEFIRDHVTFKLPYDFSYHMKTPMVHMFICLTDTIKKENLKYYRDKSAGYFMFFSKKDKVEEL